MAATAATATIAKDDDGEALTLAERAPAAGRPVHEASPVGTAPRLRDGIAKRALDLTVATALLLLLAPLIAIVAVAIKFDSRGPVFYRCRRVGHRGSELAMLKFRKMRVDASGPPLTLTHDARLTRIGRFLALSKLDEVPQLWNVLRGEMSLVGPRPEDPSFVALHPAEFEEILAVKPGVTGCCQLAFADESRILDPANRLRHYVEHLLPQKLTIDRLYAARRSLLIDLRILAWTAVAVLLRQDVAVHRETAKLSLRRRPGVSAPQPPLAPEGSEA